MSLYASAKLTRTAIHIDPVPTLEDALDIIAGRLSFFA